MSFDFINTLKSRADVPIPTVARQMGCGALRTTVVDTETATMQVVVLQGSQKEFPRTLIREISINTWYKEIPHLRHLLMASSSQEMLAGIDTAVSAEDPGEGDHTSIDKLSNQSERKKDGRVLVRTCTQSLINATGSRLLNPEPFNQSAQGWLTLKDPAQIVRMMMELTR